MGDGDGEGMGVGGERGGIGEGAVAREGEVRGVSEKVRSVLVGGVKWGQVGRWVGLAQQWGKVDGLQRGSPCPNVRMGQYGVNGEYVRMQRIVEEVEKETHFQRNSHHEKQVPFVD